MLVERSELTTREGLEDEFAAALRAQAKPLLEGVPGVEAVEIGRGVENPSKFALLVTWKDMAAHEAFKAMASYPELIAILRPYSIGGAMEHFEME